MNINKTKKGEILSMTNYMTVQSVNPSDNSMMVKDLTGMEFKIGGKQLIESGKIQSASQFEKEVKVSRTELIEKFKGTNGTAITVNFDKVDGENRTMVCYYLSPEPELGRSYVKDLEDPKSFNKQCDHRTLQWMIFNGVKYSVKK